MRHLLLAACLLVPCLARAGWERNFAESPSAEDDRNRDGLPDGWQPHPYRSPADLAWDTQVAHSGKASLRIRISRPPDGDAWDQKTGRWVSSSRQSVIPGERYTVGAWVKTKEVEGSASACIAWWNEGKWLAESYARHVSGTSDWQFVTLTAPAPPKATAGQIYLNLSGKGTAWFDDIAAVRGAALPRDFQPVDIAGACNTGFADETSGDGKGGWTDQGRNDIRSLPTGDVVFRGVPFRILDPAAHDGKSCIVLRGKGREGFPTAAAIPLDRKCETLYFLHCCGWGRQGASVGKYELQYDDGSTLPVPLTAGKEIADWWGPADTKDSGIAWEGSNPESNSIGLIVFPFANPRPEKAIQAIRFVRAPGAGDGSGGEPVPILVALTTADGPPVLTDLPLRLEFTDTAAWYPFNFPLDDTNLDSIDLTRFLDPPAGKHGFLAVGRAPRAPRAGERSGDGSGHFHFQDGARARFFGTSICGSSAFPDRDKAAMLAARLAKYGVNLLRIHAVDAGWGLGLIDYAKGDSRHLSDEALDRLDAFVAELKKRGIYLYFDLLDYRRFQDADGLTDASKFQHGWTESIKGATIFNDRLIELQKEFAEKFLTHYNPYTKLKYIDEPAVAVVEITNENSVFYFTNTALTLPVYADELRARWNQWLAEQYGGRDGLAKAWTNEKGECALLADEDPARGSVVLPMKHLYQDPQKAPFVGERSPARVSAMVRFFFGLERRYYGEMRSHLRKIGVKVPITGTNQTFCPASVYADAVNDFVARNNYWCHPNVHAKPFFTFRNLAVVNSDIAATSNPMAEVASSSVAGKPMIVPEFNFPWPNEHRAECLPLMAAYACLQDWDGLLFFAYSPDRKQLEMFGNQSDPVRWGEFPAAALLFHRQDVAVAKNTIHIGYSEADTFAGGPTARQLAVPDGRAPLSPFRYWTYVSKVRNAFFKDTYEGGATLVPGAVPVPPPAGQTRYASDTGELDLDPGRGLFTVSTPRTKGAVGFLGKSGAVALGEVQITCRTPFAAVLVTSLDGKPIGESWRLLVTAVARAENTGQAFYRNKTSVPETGRPPVLAEPVDADLRLKLGRAASVYALDETGKRRNRLPASLDNGILLLRLKEARSPWCEIVVE